MGRMSHGSPDSMRATGRFNVIDLGVCQPRRAHHLAIAFVSLELGAAPGTFLWLPWHMYAAEESIHICIWT